MADTPEQIQAAICALMPAPGHNMLLTPENVRIVCEAAKPQQARPLAEWHEDDGDVLWWRFPVEEAPYVGSPLDLGFGVEVTVGDNEFVAHVGGWPGYHTHWTLLPPVPRAPLAGEGE